jgi:glycosyltransferase involved in cell wall biosynthesis
VQRQINLNYVGTIYHGIDLENYPFVAQHQEPPYLAFLGRLAPDKGPQHAIAIAKKAGWHLKMAGKIKAIDSEFFEQEVAPHIDGEIAG